MGGSSFFELVACLFSGFKRETKRKTTILGVPYKETHPCFGDCFAETPHFQARIAPGRPGIVGFKLCLAS